MRHEQRPFCAIRGALPRCRLHSSVHGKSDRGRGSYSRLGHGAVTFSAILFGASVVRARSARSWGLRGRHHRPRPHPDGRPEHPLRHRGSIVSVIATSSGAAATYVRDQITNLRLGMFLEIATTTGAVTGPWSPDGCRAALSVVFGLVLMHAAWTMVRSPQEDVPTGVVGSPLATRLRLHGEYYESVPPAPGEVPDHRGAGGFGMMWLAGLISGLLGIGSGVFKVIAMDIMMRAPSRSPPRPATS